MKIIHLLRKEKFTDSIRALHAERFNNGEHVLCYINRFGEPSMIDENVPLKQMEIHVDSLKVTWNDMKRIDKATRDYDYIVLHAFFMGEEAEKYLSFHKKMLKRIVWIEWGYDLYDWKVQVRTLQDRAKRYYGKTARSQCNTFVAIFPPDIDFYHKRFPKATARTAYVKYTGLKVMDRYKHYSPERKLARSRENNETVVIQIGNRASRKIKHIKTLKMLERFSDENIELLIPLSYGGSKYAEKVERYAEEHFPGKVRCLKEFMDGDSYANILKNVDIAIYDTTRQIALGNIKNLIFNNVKIYMPANSVMYKYFRESGIPIQSIERLKEESYEEFISDFVIEDQGKYDGFMVSEYTDTEGRVRRWEALYDGLRAQCS